MELVELWYAQYWVPNPPELCPCEVAITYCALALLAAVELPKCCAARTASAAICDWRGVEGAVLALSAQTPAKMPDSAGIMPVPNCGPEPSRASCRISRVVFASLPAAQTATGCPK